MSNYVRRVCAFADTIVYCLIKISFIEDEEKLSSCVCFGGWMMFFFRG